MASYRLTNIYNSVRMLDMLKIRLQRVGRKNNPSFRLVLTDSKNATRSGKFLEVLGHWDFRRDLDTQIEGDKIKHWVSKGAQLTPTVHNLLLERKIITGKKINVLPKKTVAKKEEAPVAETPKTEAPAAAPVEAPATEATPAA